MTVPEILAMLHKFTQSPTLMTLAVLLGTWVAGKGIIILFKNPIARKALGLGLKTAGAPAVVLGKWLQAGPLHLVSGPVVCLLVFAGFWFFTFMDRLLTYLKPETRTMVDELEKMLGEIGSTDRKLYIMAKGMTPPQAAVVERIAEAVKAGPGALTMEQEEVILKAQAVGRELQIERLQK